MQIEDIPTATFNLIVDELKADGWEITEEYDGFDAWIDFGRLLMVKDGVSLKLEWDNWMEGIVEGPEDIVEDIRRRHQLR
jgi:hypothetical protein